jgi:hypothetical protein
MSKIQASAEDVFLSWKGDVKLLGKDRFISEERVRLLDMLAEMCRKHGVDLVDAKMVKRKVIEFMVTKEGLKGNGKHKGWKETVEDDYLISLTRWYGDDFEIAEDTSEVVLGGDPKLNYGNGKYLERNDLIVAWTKDKFKDFWDESVCLEAHNKFSHLWYLFIKENIDKEKV